MYNEDTLRAGMEQAAFFFASVLCGKPILTPTTLLTLNRVSQFPHHDLPEGMRDCSRPLRQALQAQQQQLHRLDEGAADQGRPAASSPFQRKDFLNTLPDLEEQIASLRCWHSRVVQASAAVDGVPLDDVVAQEAWETLNHASVSAAVAFQLLATASDAKGDNVLVTPAGELVGIDNDHALGMPYSRRPDGTVRVSLRSLLLCCPAVLAMPIHASVAARLTDLVPEALLLTWLGKMATVNGRSKMGRAGPRV